MTDSPADALAEADAVAVADALAGPTAGRVLDAVLGAVGATRHDWRVRSVHRRGSASVAVVYEVDLADGDGRRRDRLYVAHACAKPVPGNAARVDLDGTAVHVWQFPHDPYLPGLPTAVSRIEAARLLRRLGLGTRAQDDTDGTDRVQPAIRTRSYRPTRRAVVELRPGAGLAPAAYLKLLGGRTPERVRRRAQRLATVHEQLRPTVPVPPVLDRDPDAGRVVLGAVAGATLRAALREGLALPEPAAVRDLLADLHRLPALPDGADPDRFADIGRHVARLAARLPERAADLARLAAVADTVGGPRGTVHGDLHDGQLLVVDGVVTAVLDVDGAGTGTIAHDLGRLLAHLDASRLLAPERAERVDAYVAELEDVLHDLAPPRDLVAAAAAAWVGLATGPLRVASPDWRHETSDRIERALVWAGRAERP